MKQADIKRLEKAVKLYNKIGELLYKTYESVWKEELEFITTKAGSVSTLNSVSLMLEDTITVRDSVFHDLNLIKEQCHDGV